MGEFPTFGAEAPYIAGKAAILVARCRWLEQQSAGTDNSNFDGCNRLQPGLTLAIARPSAVAGS